MNLRQEFADMQEQIDDLRRLYLTSEVSQQQADPSVLNLLRAIKDEVHRVENTAGDDVREPTTNRGDVPSESELYKTLRTLNDELLDKYAPQWVEDFFGKINDKLRDYLDQHPEIWPSWGDSLMDLVRPGKPNIPSNSVPQMLDGSQDHQIENNTTPALQSSADVSLIGLTNQIQDDCTCQMQQNPIAKCLSQQLKVIDDRTCNMQSKAYEDSAALKSYIAGMCQHSNGGVDIIPIRNEIRRYP